MKLLLSLIIVFLLVINYSVSFHDQRNGNNRFLICFTRNYSYQWTGRCVPIWTK